jgi:hypothetical protein
MNIKQIILIIIYCLAFGGLATGLYIDAYNLKALKKSSELVTGVIEGIERNSGPKRTFKNNITISYTYKGENYTKKAYFSKIPNYYIKANVTFLLNYEKDFIFPQDIIDGEISNSLFYAIIPTILFIIAIYYELIFKWEKKLKIKTDETITPINPLKLNYNETWTCKKCGEKNPINFIYCKDCGEYK